MMYEKIRQSILKLISLENSPEKLALSVSLGTFIAL